MTSVQEPVTVRTPLAAAETEQAALRELRALLSASNGEAPLIVAGDREVTIPPTLLYLLRRLVEQLANERAVRMETFGQEVTLREAAEILASPVKYVQELLDQGQLPYQEVRFSDLESERLIKITDLLTFARERSKQRREALREMTRMSEEMGLYDLEDETCPPS